MVYHSRPQTTVLRLGTPSHGLKLVGCAYLELQVQFQRRARDLRARGARDDPRGLHLWPNLLNSKLQSGHMGTGAEGTNVDVDGEQLEMGMSGKANRRIERKFDMFGWPFRSPYFEFVLSPSGPALSRPTLSLRVHAGTHCSKITFVHELLFEHHLEPQPVASFIEQVTIRTARYLCVVRLPLPLGVSH